MRTRGGRGYEGHISYTGRPAGAVMPENLPQKVPPIVRRLANRVLLEIEVSERGERSCHRCAYYIPLRGVWYFWDYGLCTNPSSPFDGRVTNVGRGCTEYAAELGTATRQAPGN